MRLPYQFQLNPPGHYPLWGEGLGWGIAFFFPYLLLHILWEPLGNHFSIGLTRFTGEIGIPP